jgi:hypothetical protein
MGEPALEPANVLLVVGRVVCPLRAGYAIRRRAVFANRLHVPMEYCIVEIDPRRRTTAT